MYFFLKWNIPSYIPKQGVVLDCLREGQLCAYKLYFSNIKYINVWVYLKKHGVPMLWWGSGRGAVMLDYIFKGPFLATFTDPDI